MPDGNAALEVLKDWCYMRMLKVDDRDVAMQGETNNLKAMI